MLELARERRLLRKRGRRRTDCPRALGAARALNRLDRAVESLRAALGALAVAAPGWLRAHADPAWADRCAEAARTTSACRGARPRAGPSARAGRAWRACAARRRHGARRSLLAARSAGRRGAATSMGPDLHPRGGVGGVERRPLRGALADPGRGPPALAAHGGIPLRSRRSLRREARDDRVDRPQGPPDGDLRRRAAAPRHPRCHDPRTRQGSRRLGPRPRSAGGKGSVAEPSSRGRRPPRRPVSS